MESLQTQLLAVDGGEGKAKKQLKMLQKVIRNLEVVHVYTNTTPCIHVHVDCNWVTPVIKRQTIGTKQKSSFVVNTEIEEKLHQHVHV